MRFRRCGNCWSPFDLTDVVVTADTLHTQKDTPRSASPAGAGTTS